MAKILDIHGRQITKKDFGVRLDMAEAGVTEALVKLDAQAKQLLSLNAILLAAFSRLNIDLAGEAEQLMKEYNERMEELAKEQNDEDKAPVPE